GVEGGRFNIVPVDFVANAIDHLAHQSDRDGECFHLTADRHYSLGEVVNIFAAVADAPKMAVSLDNSLFRALPGIALLRKGLASQPTSTCHLNRAQDSHDHPEATLKCLTCTSTYAHDHTRTALEGSGIQAPELESYAQMLWDYWANHLDPE